MSIMNESPRVLYLCAGTQSSGSTLVSWCFLQHPDLDGVLDARFDALPIIPDKLSAPNPWVKFTIACFRFSEVQSHFEDEGYVVRPLLVVRDVRAVFNSLLKKKYGRNGITADDPPLRLRLRRFREDWDLFRQRGWPILRFEDFVEKPEAALREAAAAMGLRFDDAMLSWPKPLEQIADGKYGNATFTETRGANLVGSVKPAMARVATQNIPPDDLTWLEAHFAEMNAALGYAAHVQSTWAGDGARRAVPRFENTRRFERLQRQNRFFNSMGRRVGKLASDAASAVLSPLRDKPAGPSRET